MKKRVLFVTGSLAHGGAERHSMTLLHRLTERGYDCHAVYVKNEANHLEQLKLSDENSVHCLQASRFLDHRALLDFSTRLLKLRPAILFAANGYALMYASLAKMHCGLDIPIVATFHSTKLLGAREQVKMLLDRPFFWHARCTVFVCAMQKKYWLRRAVGSRQNLVIHNGVDTEHFVDRSSTQERQALRQSLGFASHDYVIGISAVLRPEKNHLQLLNAVATLRHLGIPARILMIGDGPLRAVIEARSQALKLQNSVHISGFVSDVRPYLAACDVKVLCSLSETFSLAALEAMAMGKPVIHSDVGGAAEMIFPGQNGYLFPAGNDGELLSRLLSLSDPGQAKVMGIAAREVVDKHFSEKNMVDRYETIVRDLSASPTDLVATSPLQRLVKGGAVSEVQLKQGVSPHENL